MLDRLEPPKQLPIDTHAGGRRWAAHLEKHATHCSFDRTVSPWAGGATPVSISSRRLKRLWFGFALARGVLDPRRSLRNGFDRTYFLCIDLEQPLVAQAPVDNGKPASSR